MFCDLVSFISPYFKFFSLFIKQGWKAAVELSDFFCFCAFEWDSRMRCFSARPSELRDSINIWMKKWRNTSFRYISNYLQLSGHNFPYLYMRYICKKFNIHRHTQKNLVFFQCRQMACSSFFFSGLIIWYNNTYQTKLSA